MPNPPLQVYRSIYFSEFVYNGSHTLLSFPWFIPTGDDALCGWRAMLDPTAAMGLEVTYTAADPTVAPQAAASDLSRGELAWAAPQAPGSTVTYTIAVPRHLETIRQLCVNSAMYPGQRSDECILLAVSKAGVQLVTAMPRSVADGQPGCTPGTAAPQHETSFSLQYYERTVTSTSTTFVFLLAVQDQATCAGSKAHCEKLCSWSLFVREGITSQLSAKMENLKLSDSTFVTTGSNSSVTWAHKQGHDSAETYQITVPGDVSLFQLCRPSTFSSQGAHLCAAVVSGAKTYTTVFFNEADLLVKAALPRPAELSCSAYKPLKSSCMSVRSTRYTGLSGNTTFVLYVQHDGTSKACLREAQGDMFALRVLLEAQAVEDLKSRRQFSPGEAVLLDSASGVTWLYTPPSNMSIHYMLNMQGDLGLENVCRQGALPDQPAGTCVIEFISKSLCLRSYMQLDQTVTDPKLVPMIPKPGGSGKSRDVDISNANVLRDVDGNQLEGAKAGSSYRNLASGTVLAVVLGTILPVVVGAAAIGAYMWYRKRSAMTVTGGQTSWPGSGNVSPAHSDISINLPGPPGASTNI